MIFDAILFNNEVDLLEIRLHELSSVVDRFIVVESLEYHGSSNTKVSNFLANLDVFRPFMEKIEYVLLERLDPPHRGPNDSWPRENFHRNAILSVLAKFGVSSDVVLISDCDEIPRASSVLQYIEEIRCAPRSFTQDFFYYDVNNYLGTWHGTIGASFRDVRNLTPQGLRNKRDEWPAIPNAGWHFSYFGGYDRIKKKIENFAHACEDTIKLAGCRSREDLVADMLAGRDLYQRPGEGRKERRSHDDPRLPAYMRAHILGKYRLATEEGLKERLS